MTSAPPPESTDKRARFEAAAVPFMSAVYGMALRLTHSPEDARDLVQDTYVRAFRGFDGFAPGTNCKAWLLKILYSVFVNRYRKARREPQGIPIEELENRYHLWSTAGGAAGEGTPGEVIERAPDEAVEAALRELPESFRSAVLLVDVEELSYDEAAAALECPVGTLRSRLHRARRLLFAALLEYARRKGYVRGPVSQ